MAAEEEKTITDQLFEEMKSIAVEQQQCFYELLPDCTIYKSDQHKYLKQNIGYALFGPPTKNETEVNTENPVICYGKTENPNDTEADITDAVGYDSKAEKVIDSIYKKICDECINIKANPLQPIYFGVIYNVIVYFNTNAESKKKEEKATKKETEAEVKKASKKETEEEVKEATKKETEAEVKEEKVSVVPIPVFKVRKSIQKTDDAKKPSTSTKNEVDFETWYIDTNARVYESWKDYTENNTLPKCSMVLPKDGFYQPNPDYPVEKDYSTVWIEIMDSPACALTNQVYENVDYVSKAIGIGVLGLGIAGLFTPFAPLASIPVATAATASGVWTIIRNSQELIDRYNHKESISFLDREAFPCWLGLTGSVAGLGAVGGSAFLSKAAANGTAIPTAAKVAFNTVQGSTLFLSGVSVVFMSYNVYEKYMEEQTFSYIDVLSLATHVMFFASSVVNVKFANDIIKDSQGRIIDEYKKTRRSKNLRRKFNRTARKAAENNTCKISENAEVIKFIRNRQDFLSFESNLSNVENQTFDKTSYNWSFDHGKIKIGNIILLDPIEYVLRLISSGIFFEPDQSSPSDSQDNCNNFNQLKQFIHDLLTELCPEDTPTFSDFDKLFDQLLEDLNSMKISKECLRILFNITVTLMKNNRTDHFFVSFAFIWQYCKANLEQWGIKTRRRMQSESGSYIMQKIVIIVSEATGMIFDNLATAAFMYAEAYLHSSKYMKARI